MRAFIFYTDTNGRERAEAVADSDVEALVQSLLMKGCTIERISYS